MPRVHKVNSARKDYPDFGIKKGDTYYYWSKRYGGMKKSLTYPDRKQLTSSDFLIQVWGIEDEIGKTQVDCSADFENIKEEFEAVIQGYCDELQNLSDECQEKLDNIPEQLQYAPVGELLQGRIDSLEEMISELENIDYDINKEDFENDEDFNDKVDEINIEIQGICYNGD